MSQRNPYDALAIALMSVDVALQALGLEGEAALVLTREGQVKLAKENEKNSDLSYHQGSNTGVRMKYCGHYVLEGERCQSSN